MKNAKIIGLIVLGLIVLLLIMTTLVSIYFNWQAHRKPEYDQFATGVIPTKPPEGNYTGQTKALRSNWRGKKFDSANGTGINIFKDGERYPFHTYIGQSLTNRHQLVFKIDYNQRGNPWWLRFVVDELVQTGPDQFLGKIQVNIIPGAPFTVGYFTLQK